MFCIEAKDLSTHGLMFGRKITNEEQVFEFMGTGSSWLSLAGWTQLPWEGNFFSCLLSPPLWSIIPHPVRGPLLVRISFFFFFKSTPPIIQLDSLDSPAVIMIQYPVVGSRMDWWDRKNRVETRKRTRKMWVRSTSNLNLQPSLPPSHSFWAQEGHGKKPRERKMREGETKS